MLPYFNQSKKDKVFIKPPPSPHPTYTHFSMTLFHCQHYSLPYSLTSSPIICFSLSTQAILDLLLSLENAVIFSSVQSLSHVQLFVTPWIAARQASLSITNSRSLLKLMSIQTVIPSSHLILCRPLLLLSPSPPSIRVFSNDSTLRMRWPKLLEFQLQHQSFQRTPRTDHP